VVDRAVRQWAAGVVAARPEVLRIGYFGSYARGDWGVGSDLDLVIIVDRSNEPFERRAAQWDVTGLPVPTEVIAYTREEWQGLDPQGRFSQAVKSEAVWVYPA
jgi:hypothetical protein